MFLYKICYTAGTYNYWVDEITLVVTTSGHSCTVLVYLKQSDYCGSLTISFAKYSLKLLNFSFDHSTETKGNISSRLIPKGASTFNTPENNFSLQYFIFYYVISFSLTF